LLTLKTNQLLFLRDFIGLIAFKTIARALVNKF